jgi:hypothetical protein
MISVMVAADSCRPKDASRERQLPEVYLCSRHHARLFEPQLLRPFHQRICLRLKRSQFSKQCRDQRREHGQLI